MTDRFAQNQIVSERYQILSLIGEGGMGLVYQVKQIFLQKEFALKTIKKTALSDLVVRRFQQEARAAFALKHENIIGVNDFGILSDSTPFLVMELITGETLGQKIKRLGRLPLEEALPIFVQVCKGLDFAHKHGVVHRDVKPNNIMLVQDGSSQKAPVVKIVDFGIAKIAGHEEGEIQALTRTGEIFGSPLYMSPEQCLGSRIDNRSDIYSLGCVFFEALTGLPPFVGENALSTMMKHKGENHETLSQASLGLKFPPSLEEIVSRMLAKDPADRYESLDIVAADLQLLQGGKKISHSKQAPLIVAESGQNNQIISMTRTKFYLALAAVGLTSLGVAAIIFLALQSHKPQTDYDKISSEKVSQLAALKAAEKLEQDKREIAKAEDDSDGLRILDDKELDRRWLHPETGHPTELSVTLRKVTEHALERISQSNTISKITFTNCGIEAAGLAHLANMNNLAELNFSGSNVDDSCVKYFRACKKLLRLGVSQTKITDVGLTAINRIPTLKSLAASKLQITNAGFKAPSPGLTYLDLRQDHGITNDSLSTIAGLKLEKLELDGTSIDDEGLKALTRTKSLIQIGLSNTRVTLAGLRTLFANLPKLTRFDLSVSPTLSEKDIAQLEREIPPRITIKKHGTKEPEVR